MIAIKQTKYKWKCQRNHTLKEIYQKISEVSSITDYKETVFVRSIYFKHYKYYKGKSYTAITRLTKDRSIDWKLC